MHQKRSSKSSGSLFIFFTLFMYLAVANAEISETHRSFLTSTGYKLAAKMITKSIVNSLWSPCRNELGPSSPSVNYYCYQASKALGRSLDIRLGPQGILAFSNEMDQLMSSPDTLIYLNDLINYYKIKSPQNTNFNQLDLWEWTLNHPSTHNSKDEALRIIGVLFQDFTGDGFIRVSLYNKKLSQPDEIHMRLAEALEIIKNQFSSPQELKMENENIHKSKLYHFYAIAYAAFKVTKELKDPAYGFIIPFLMNRSYEFISIRLREYLVAPSQDLPGEVPATFEPFFYHLFHSPNVKSQNLSQKFESDQIGDAEHDIYLGYRGALFGASVAIKKPLPFLNQKDFGEIFRKSPFELSLLKMQMIQKN